MEGCALSVSTSTILTMSNAGGKNTLQLIRAMIKFNGMAWEEMEWCTYPESRLHYHEKLRREKICVVHQTLDECLASLKQLGLVIHDKSKDTSYRRLTKKHTGMDYKRYTEWELFSTL